ncbi:MAG: DEAD/DEAH box helicase [Proteobacteria bacterium]|nr:DEAD/DEAH box helicase [Pseudomonadota bacterium]
MNDLNWAQPLVRDWFLQKFGQPTEPQKQGWPSILAGKTTLISAPTGSGKTLAGFLIAIEQLVRQALSNQLLPRPRVIYISPLKALGNDVQKNLSEPLAEITALALQRGFTMQEISVAVRTGDTPMKERQAMLKKPPHILVTTPESLYILLTAEKSRQFLTDVHTVIIDEIHALAGDKRGAHLTLSLERLQALCRLPLVRIGLSATQKPIEIIGRFLAGNNRPAPVIVNIGHLRTLDLKVEIPKQILGAVASNEMWDEVYDRIAEMAAENRAILVFVNTRRLAERAAHHLAKRIGEDKVAAHHGSLSRKLRLAAEAKLKKGELNVLVATASLELGIDIGMIDLVCQLGSPRSIAVALQRIGRAGHWLGAIPKGRLFATTRDELVECSALAAAIQQGNLDQLVIPKQPIDIAMQQIIALCATGEWREPDLFHLIKQAYHYGDLSLEIFNAMIAVLSEGIAGSRGRYSAYLHRDGVNGIVRARRGARLAAITSGGAIPENGLFTVVSDPEATVVGTLDEDFAIESNRGDIILLGSTSWQIQRIESLGRVIVTDAKGAPPSVPFWLGEAPARTDELSVQVSQLRTELIDRLRPLPVSPQQKAAAISWLKQQCLVGDAAAEQLIEYFITGHAALGAVPSQNTIIAERFFDEGGGMQLIIHAPFGARINKAWGLALRKCFCRSFNFELQAAATDNGLNIALAEQHSFPLADVFRFLHPNSLQQVLVQAVLQSPLFKTRWRWDAMRALALLRFRNGKKIPLNILRILSDDLLAAVFPEAAACQDNLAGKDLELPDHPLINEVIKDCLAEALDLQGLQAVLNKIINGNIQCLAIDTPAPSVFAHEILNANPYAFLDDAPLEERRARAVELRRILPESLGAIASNLDPIAIVEVQEQAWPVIGNREELHDALQTLIAFPAQEQFRHYFNDLCSQGRARVNFCQGIELWWAQEQADIFSALYLQLETDEFLPALVKMLQGWMFHSGPVTAKELATQLALPLEQVDLALLKLETMGVIIRGQFKKLSDADLQWCERRLLARIHRLTLDKLRKQIEPVTAIQYMQWLLQWQHVAANTQLAGESGLVEIIRQLQGFELPAKSWEQEILAKRIRNYDPALLDRLCLTGVIGWGRCSAHPAEKAGKRIIANSISPITFFIREQFPQSALQKSSFGEILNSLSHIAQQILTFLQQRGACFFGDIERGINHLKSEVESGLWELVAAGLVTADSFDNLRALIDPQRRSGKKGKWARASFSIGRWSLLSIPSDIDEEQRKEFWCWCLLKRYGVIFKNLLARESNCVPWGQLLPTLRRLEARGEIRAGRFISGFLGEQFALPYVVASLRQIKHKSMVDSYSVSAVDPLNLAGIILPGDKIPAQVGKIAIFSDSLPF